jgi:hypothetical protein
MKITNSVSVCLTWGRGGTTTGQYILLISEADASSTSSHLAN